MGTKNKKWYQADQQEVLTDLQVQLDDGLNQSAVEERLKTYGYNQLQSSKRINPITLFVRQFKDALMLILLVAALVSWGVSLVDDKAQTEPLVCGASECSSNEINELIGSAIGCDRTTKEIRATDVYCKNPSTLCTSQYRDGVEELCSGLDESEGGGAQEAGLILAIVFAIAVIGFLNEFKAEKTVEALRKLVSQEVKVRRNGTVVTVDSARIVPGDVVLLDEGVKVPADVRLVISRSLRVNEASLTGESLPVSKNVQKIDKNVPLGDQKNMVFAGTFVAQGTAEGVVVETGQHTELGKIASLVSDVDTEETPMQRKLDALGKRLGLLIAVICVVVFAIVLLLVDEARGKDLLPRLIFAFTAAVALAVAAIPEGLAFVVRISLALGARRMAAKNALVRKLSAVEALGSTDVICSDKTGTLTRGEMTVRELYAGGQSVQVSGSGYDTTGGGFERSGKHVELSHPHEKLLIIGALCNNAQLKDDAIIGDPTEGSLLVSAAKGHYEYKRVQKNYPRVNEIPFTSERKLMSTVHEVDGEAYFVAAKGSVEAVIERCSYMLDAKGKIIEFKQQDKQDIVSKNSQLASKALRVLAFAYKDIKKEPASDQEIESDLVFVGLQAMMDPPREEVVEVIGRVQAEAGMRVIMITGDYIETAKAVAAEIGIVGDAVSGADLDAMSQSEFEDAVEKISVYARVNPEHKIRIVQALKSRGHQVAMTGDGVNDAPAIKAADIGIAMGVTGTDASKEAADLILLDDQFLTIINAIEEGRGIFDNVRKFVNFLISCNIAEVLAILFGILLFNNLLLTAAQILFINIITDGLPAVALGSDPTRSDALRDRPSKFQESILTKRIWVEIFVFGVFMSVAIFVQYWYNRTHGVPAATTSAVFASMVIYELVRLVDIRTDYKIRWFANPTLSLSILASIISLLAVLYVPVIGDYFGVGPLAIHDWLFIGVGSCILFGLMKLINPALEKYVGSEQ